jgi:hypothetical protein
MEKLEKKKPFWKNKYFKIAVFILLTLIIPYLTIPGLLIWLFQRSKKISKKFKITTYTLIGILFIGLLVYCINAYAKDPEPSLEIVSPQNNIEVQTDSVEIKGTYKPQDRTVWFNGKKIQAENGSFSSSVTLQKGENIIKIQAGDWKRATVNLTVVRVLTPEELTKQEADRKIQEEKAKADAEAKAKKETEAGAKKQNTSTPTPKPTIKATPTQPSITDQLWKALDDSIKTRKEYDLQYQEVTKQVTLTHTASDFWDETELVKGGWSTLVKYGTEAFKIGGVDKVKIVVRTNFTNQYGNDDIEDAMRISMTKDEFSKYNWNNLNYQLISTQMENSLVEYYIHPAVLKNVKYDKLWLSL